MYEDTDARKWWNFPNYSFREDKSTGLVEKVYRTENDIKQMEDGNAAKWRREYEVVRPLTQYSTSINVPVMRYSDVLLMIAEAANEVNGGPTQEAEDAINEVRSRAGASKIKFGNYDLVTFRELVRDERARELAFEGHRWFDLRRSTRPRLEKVLDGTRYVLEENDARYTLAIPKEAIEANPGLLN